jgi:secreted protein with Ig-like and vWFA domain
VLDASSSEGTLNFQKQLDFVSRVANDFQIGPNHVQIGMLTFSDYPNLEFYLNQYTDKASLLSAIQKTGYLTGVTNTDQALKYTRENMFSPKHGARDDAKNYMIILTDGASSNANLTLQEANLLKNQHIEILAVGIGSNINSNELNSMGSDSNHVFTVSSFDALKTVRTDIKKAACEGML